MQSQLLPTLRFGFNGISIGRVYQINSDSNSVDIMMLDGSIYKNVRVASSFASSQSGVINLPLPKYENERMVDRKLNPLKEANQNECDVLAIVACLNGSITNPICLGFLYPNENEILCGVEQAGNKDGTMFLWKHPSNIYVRVAKGNEVGDTPEFEISHPSGFFIKIGKEEFLTQITNWDQKIRSFNAKNPETKENDSVPIVTINHPSGTTIKIDKDGNVELNIKGNLEETINGNVTRVIKGDLDETIEGDIILDCLGTKDETVNAAWNRKSNILIKDEAPTIDHN